MDETINTLKFASRAKRIRQKPVVNEVTDERALLRRYREEIAELKRQLALYESTGVSDEVEMDGEEGEYETLEDMLRRFNRLNALILNSQNVKGGDQHLTESDSGEYREDCGNNFFRPRVT